MRRFLLARFVIGACLVFPVARVAAAQPAEPPDDAPQTMLPHPPGARWWLSGQLNVIAQAHDRFRSPYEGENSFRSDGEHAVSRVWTLYTGVAVTRRLDILLDVESAGGRGLSDALGLAGFTNLDVVRNPTLGSAPSLARAMVHWTIPVGDDETRAAPTALSLASRLPARRFEVRVGKMSVADFFDVNAAASDSHLQFTNWTVDNNGAYDYAADTRGYTWAAMVEYDAPRWSVRFAEALMPTVANGIDMDWNIARAGGENLEIEARVPHLVVRALGYVNRANMGSYDEAIAEFAAGGAARPDIVAHRAQERTKTGVGGNVEYSSGGGVR